MLPQSWVERRKLRHRSTTLAVFKTWVLAPLTARDGPDNDERLFAGRDRIGQWGVWRLVGEVLFAGEEAQAQKTQKRRALLGVVVACCPKTQRAPWDHGQHFLLTARVRYRAVRDRAWVAKQRLRASPRCRRAPGFGDGRGGGGGSSLLPVSFGLTCSLQFRPCV